jgi:6-phosphogluconolactonase (cycloisomerase 2 family)
VCRTTAEQLTAARWHALLAGLTMRASGEAGNLLVENNGASHPLDEAVSADQKYLYIVANGLSQIVGYRVGRDGSLTQVTTAPVAAGSGGLGAN